VSNVQRRLAIVTSLSLALLLVVSVRTADAQRFLPPPGKIFQGVTSKPVSQYIRAVGKHPAVYQEFVAWGQYLPGITQDAITARARMMIHITTGYGSSEAITPAGIASGRGDAWLIGLQQAIFQSHNITYIRLMAEMNNANNFYCAYNTDGSPRDAAHSTTQFKRAWKRVTLIMRGGSLARIDAQLHRLGMPALHASHDLPKPKIAMLWVPMVAGGPDVPGNEPNAYWPGGGYVDWVGTDFYSKFPNWSGLEQFYGLHPHEPFVFGEYALWGADGPGFINQLFGWIGSHSRTRMVIYNPGTELNGPFRLWRYPNSARALRRWLASSRYPAFAPEWATGRGGVSARGPVAGARA
jgi:hypothetical protein